MTHLAVRKRAFSVVYLKRAAGGRRAEKKGFWWRVRKRQGAAMQAMPLPTSDPSPVPSSPPPQPINHVHLSIPVCNKRLLITLISTSANSQCLIYQLQLIWNSTTSQGQRLFFVTGRAAESRSLEQASMLAPPSVRSGRKQTGTLQPLGPTQPAGATTHQVHL